MNPGTRSTLPNGFNGPWNPICPECGGYMHAGHTPDCPVTLARERRHREIADLMVTAHRKTKDNTQ